MKELKNDGIITISSKTIRHSTIGDYVVPSKEYPNGRLEKGGHSYKCFEELDKRGIPYSITRTFHNGVRAGYLPTHKQPFKKGVSERYPNGDIGQTWFPENWTDDDILVAGTFIANKPEESIKIFRYGTYNGVRICTIIEQDTGEVGTIYPHNEKQPNEEGWEKAK